MPATNHSSNLRALLYALQGRRAEIALEAVEDMSNAANRGRKTDSTGYEHGKSLKIVQEEIEAVLRAIEQETATAA